jgi:hypothetical protein
MGASGHFQEEQVARASLPRTTKAKLVFLLPADHRLAEIAPVDPEALLVAELHAQARKLQEQCPGARARAPRQKGAQPDRRIHQHQLDGVALACTGKQKQARQRQSRTLHVSKVTTFF